MSTAWPTAQRDAALAERIVSIKRAIAGNVHDAERDRVAHDLSSASLEVHWSKVSLVLGTAPRTERTQAMAARLKELVARAGIGIVSPGLCRWWARSEREVPRGRCR